MQLIVGCRARGASWAGSETLVIPGKRLTIHVRAYTRTHTQLLISHPRVRVQGDPFRAVLDFVNNYLSKSLNHV